MLSGCLLSLKLVEVRGRRLGSQTLAEQEVPCVAVRNILDLALFAGALDILQ